MEGVAVGAPASSIAASCYVSWEEVNASSDKGRREVHYYLKRRDGCSSDLAVIGKEKNSRHMSYHDVISNTSFTTSLNKLKSRREVVDWLNSIVSGSPVLKSSQSAGRFLGGKEVPQFDSEAFKDVQSRTLGQYTKEFLWLGSPWISRKKRKHYQSFCRNGVKVSVHDFVYVLAEENKRLVAYLEDMYEDSRGNKMVVVRWFHKIDEVGIFLPHNFNDREIFFSLCLQDLSIECIDGLATVLSSQHFEKFQNEVTHAQLQPFICDKQFEDDDVKPFDITQVKGYWKQEIIRHLFTFTYPKNYSSSQQPFDGQRAEEIVNDVVETRPKKRLRQSKDADACNCTNRKEPMDAAHMDLKISNKNSVDGGLGTLAGFGGAALLSKKEADASSQYLKVGSHVEVLSQDSGMRGCWYRASVIKKHKDKVKVRYDDVQDAADEVNLLEEWVLASRVAAPDQLGLRVSGRKIVRPSPESHKGRVVWAIDVGTIVDAWWHDGWWEGIVIQKDSEDKLHVYFPGEKQKSIFSLDDLRHSQEWFGNGWMFIKERSDVVSSILSCLGTKQDVEKSCDGNLVQATPCVSGQQFDGETEHDEFLLDSGDEKIKNLNPVPDLAKDDLLAQLKWKSSKKRRRGGGSSSVHRLHCQDPDGKNTRAVMGSGFCERFLFPASIKVDDNCKYMRGSLFKSSVVSPLTSLVMSR